MGKTVLEVFEFEQNCEALIQARKEEGVLCSLAGVTTALSSTCFVVQQFGNNLQHIVQQVTETYIPNAGWEVTALACFAITGAFASATSVCGYAIGQRVADDAHYKNDLALRLEYNS